MTRTILDITTSDRPPRPSDVRQAMRDLRFTLMLDEFESKRQRRAAVGVGRRHQPAADSPFTSKVERDE